MADPVILVAGSLHHDVIVEGPHLPAPDETVAGQAVSQAFGGKGGNQAVAAARMGAKVQMAGAVGRDSAAKVLLAALDAAGVGRRQVQRVPGASGMSVAILQPDGSYGAVIVSAANLAFDPRAVAFPRGLATLVLQNEIPEPANLFLARRARSMGAKVILNAAPARPTDPHLLRLLDLLVVNRGEADALLGQTLPPPQAARALVALGPAEAIVTLGAEGLAASGFAQPAFPASVVSTHGAGDALIGALAAEWTRGAPLEQAARFAQAAAALHVATPPEARGAITPQMVRARLA